MRDSRPPTIHYASPSSNQERTTSSYRPGHVTRVLAAIAGCGVGAFAGILLWYIAFWLIVPDGSDFTGYLEGLIMLLVSPFFVIGGLISGGMIGYRLAVRVQSAGFPSIVEVNVQSINLYYPKGRFRLIRWHELCEVRIQVVNGGLTPKAHWLLVAESSEYLVPMEAKGADDLLTRFMELRGFDGGAVAQALGSTDGHYWVCWRREPAEALEVGSQD